MTQPWLDLFKSFLKEIRIDSKETGIGPLNPYNSQTIFLNEIAEGLDRGVHEFVCLKARQLGISTMSLAIDLFWLFMHEGLQGALVTDTDDNRDKFRVILNRYLQSLPRSWRVETKIHNRTQLVLSNGSVLDYVVAGVKKGRGQLGRSRAWNFIHATECSSYGDQEAVDSLVASLAQNNPDRLYIFESTARGPNAFCEMWDTAESDPTKHRFFIGWWAKEEYSIKRSDRRYKMFMDDELTDFERQMIEEVKKTYKHRVSDEQLAWWRWYRDTHISSEAMMDQEFPWTADQAFIVTGKIFFPPKKIVSELKRVAREVTFKGYRYHVGEDFRATTLEQVRRDLDAELRIFEEPVAHGVYAIGCDPAYGSNEYKDSHCIEILRCYADRTLQVAELATPDVETYQLTWFLAHLAGAYRNCIINLEIIGPGAAVMTEFRHLKQLVLEGRLDFEGETGDWKNIFANSRWYLYNKPDSMGSGFCYNWKTNSDNKQMIMNKLRDEFSQGRLRIQSRPALREMEKVVQDGSAIVASGRGKDDRVMGLALANEAYTRWLRPGLISNEQTYAKVASMEEERGKRNPVGMIPYVVEDFFKRRERDRFERELETY